MSHCYDGKASAAADDAEADADADSGVEAGPVVGAVGAAVYIGVDAATAAEVEVPALVAQGVDGHP